jgi:hypothetical protein
MKIRYAPADYGMDFADAWELSTNWDTEHLDYIAEECADDYHGNHDGWESSWPVTFMMWDDQGQELGSCEVERDVEPVFRAAWRSLKVSGQTNKE